MPELPEVETLRRSLEPRLTRRTITSVTLHRRDILVVPGDPEGGFSRAKDAPRPKRYLPSHLLAGARIASLERKGKQLAILAEDGRALVVQLGMTGTLRIARAAAKLPKPHRHATFRLDSGERLAFIDPRRFGGLRAFDTTRELGLAWKSLGPDAFDATPDELAAALLARPQSTRPIKAALLDQQVIAGCGNIYADEALFAAKLHPQSPIASMMPSQALVLASKLRDVIVHAVEKGGSTIRDYTDALGKPGTMTQSHAAYARAGKPCLTCDTPLVSALIAQRTTTWCPACQPAPSL